MHGRCFRNTFSSPAYTQTVRAMLFKATAQTNSTDNMPNSNSSKKKWLFLQQQQSQLSRAIRNIFIAQNMNNDNYSTGKAHFPFDGILNITLPQSNTSSQFALPYRHHLVTYILFYYSYHAVLIYSWAVINYHYIFSQLHGLLKGKTLLHI